MKLSRKINKLLISGTIGFALVLGGSFANKPYLGQTTVAQIAQALSPEQVNLRAKQIIVRIDGASVGSGSLIETSDGVYTVLTNWHVMKNEGEYFVSTIDGRQHQVDPNSIKQLPGLDLAILKFNSNQNYQVAELGDSANLNEGQSVYFAGYPGELRREDNRYYRFFAANLVGILPKPTENGYSLVYNGEAFPGMSGGPVFNKNGLVIGVHGEANVHALSGGTSNYAVPINSYQTAIANLNKPAEETPTPPAETANTPESPPESNDAPEQTAVQPEASPDAESNPTSESNNSSETANPDKVSSVPTFTPEPSVENSAPKSETSETTDETAADNPEVSTDPTPKKNNNVSNKTEAEETEEAETSTTNTPRKISLVSKKTGIDYTPLKDSLEAEQWSEADLQTYKLVEQIVQTAKQKNKHVFIELKTIAEFSCPDIRTIDSLWKKYTGNKFGFSSQQEVWQSVNQKGDFSTQTWRNFATQVGWKEGDVASGSGYLLYDQLDFNPSEAPTGHLPWWFALPDEEQKVIKHLFTRCNFNPSPQELAAEEGKKPKKPRENNTQQDKKPRDEPDIEKSPK